MEDPIIGYNPPSETRLQRILGPDGVCRIRLAFKTLQFKKKRGPMEWSLFLKGRDHTLRYQRQRNPAAGDIYGFRIAATQNFFLAETAVSSCHLLLRRVESPGFENPPDTVVALPGVSKIIRKLSTDECGKRIIRLAEHPQREVFYPKRQYGFSLVAKETFGLVRYRVRSTGKKRSWALPASPGL